MTITTKKMPTQKTPTKKIPGVIIAAPASGSGKTIVTAAILRAFKNNGDRVAPIKIGPDYIDPTFHSHAAGADCINLDQWAMPGKRMQNLAATHIQNLAANFIVAEGVMGLFDGAKDGSGGATSDVALAMDWPIILLIDASAQGQSIAALIKGFLEFNPTIRIEGVILNKVGGVSHALFLKNIINEYYPELCILGHIMRDDSLAYKSRHLGLVMAGEIKDISKRLNQCATLIANNINIKKIAQMAVGNDDKENRKYNGNKTGEKNGIGGGRCSSFTLSLSCIRHVAIARDAAFSFIYIHLLQEWRDNGVKISFFSPLNDEVAKNDADMVFLPGGYPELFLEKICNANHFKKNIQERANGPNNDSVIYGECGGYMVLGKSIIGQDNNEYEMIGIFDLKTSFAPPHRHLGYRKATLLWDVPLLGNRGDCLHGHEFHHANIIHCGYGDAEKPLFSLKNTADDNAVESGHLKGNMMASFFHVI